MKRTSRAEYLAEAVLMTLGGGAALIGNIAAWKDHDGAYRSLFLIALAFLGLAAYDWYRWFRYDKIQWSEEDLRVLTRKECRSEAIWATVNVLLWCFVMWLNLRNFDPTRDGGFGFMTTLFAVVILTHAQRAAFTWMKYIRSGERDDLPAGTN